MTSERPIPADIKTFGARVRYLRKLRGFSQGALAKLVGISQPSISDLENDVSKEPSAPTLLRMAAVLQANPEWMLNGKGHPLTVEVSDTAAKNEMASLFAAMTPEQQAAMLSTARVLVSK
jgi:transcriptional regulator with XRE-family HTH domain